MVNQYIQFMVNFRSIHFSGVDCGNPTNNLTLLNQNLLTGSISDTIYLANSFITCLKGFQWSDGMQFKNISCGANGAWVFQASCIGRY